jgi:hypothetical protein
MNIKCEPNINKSFLWGGKTRQSELISTPKEKINKKKQKENLKHTSKIWS